MKKLNANERLEIIAHAFNAKHNMLPPFKDQIEGPNLDERIVAYDYWWIDNDEIILAMLAAFDAVMADE